MKTSSIIIVADRGSLKAYRVNSTPTRGASLQLIQAFDLTDGHRTLQDQLTDDAGQFPVADGTGGRHASSAGERGALEIENEKRICRELAQRVEKILAEETKENWSFAAPASIHSAIVEMLPPALTARLAEQLKADLVKIEPTKLAAHFQSIPAT